METDTKIRDADLELLLAEFDIALALAGVPQASTIGPTSVEIRDRD